ncbi:hypothetical protein D3C78_1112000 [compost metagenome]
MLGEHLAGRAAFRHQQLGALTAHALHHALGQQRIEQLLLGEGFLEVRAGEADQVDEARYRVAVDVVLGIGITDGQHTLGMGFQHMEGFQEGFQTGLPVGRQQLAHVQGDELIGEIPLGEMLGKDVQMLGQRCGIWVEVDEDEAAPGLDLELRQAEALILHVREVPATGHVGQLAFQRPGEAVERAAQLLRTTAGAGGLQLGAAVQAGIGIGLDAAILGAHHQHGLLDDLIDVVVARFRDVFYTAGPLPNAAPQLFLLESEKVAGGVVLVGDVLVAQEAIGRIGEMARRVIAVRSDDVGGAGSRTTSLTRRQMQRFIHVRPP